MNASFALFSTPIGVCGTAWGERGVVGVWLPESDERQGDSGGAVRPPAELTRERLLRRLPDAAEAPPPSDVRRAIEDITALLSGDRRDLSGIRLDFDDVQDFPRRVYEIARSILPGETLTYGEVARKLGDPLRAREVGQALARNPFPIVVPCHRVLAANGRSGGFSAPGGVSTKLRLLEIEGARAAGIPTLF
jgi:methylated-DNA-[protein]-cysteine S-methyltransferase